MILIEHLIQSLRSAAHLNSNVQVPPACILWPDKERQWSPAIRLLQTKVPELIELGQFQPSERTGPAIWVKCAVAGLIEEVDLCGRMPIVYLPGVGRADLRAIESCPRDLQPLAELQYRGVYWSQINAKDWTIAALLSAKHGGAGLDVAQDRATLDALSRTLSAGVLLEQPIVSMKGRSINAGWLDSLLAPNPARDILAWLNQPDRMAAEWAGAKWDVFVGRCKKDYDFDPKADGQLVAAEKLARRAGAWAAIWELYRDSYSAFPGVVDALERVAPPKAPGLFDDVSGYPKANSELEGALRYRLASIGEMGPTAARAAILNAESESAERRKWLWDRMGLSPLADAIEHLAVVAELTTQLPTGSTLDELAASYQGSAWRADASALEALAAVTKKADIDAVVQALKSIYKPWLEELALRFQELARKQGGLGGTPQAAPEQNGRCTVFVDGLRFDVANFLVAKLATVGKAKLSTAWTCIPSVTASGKAWASPVANLVSGTPDDADFQPNVAAGSKPLNAHNFRKLLDEQNIQHLAQSETGNPEGQAWTECGDLDHYGHEHGLRLARDIDQQLNVIVERLVELRDAGWSQIRVVTDHGWLLVPGGLPKAELAKHETETRWGRCAILKDTSHGTPLTFGWSWCEAVQVAMAPGISSFIAGAEYAHGGLSIQECLVPIISMTFDGKTTPLAKADIVSVVWRGLRCRVEVSASAANLAIDLRTKANSAGSSVLSQVRKIEDGQASVAVEDDALEGTVVVVVVLDAAGNVIQKATTTIGAQDN